MFKHKHVLKSVSFLLSVLVVFTIIFFAIKDEGETSAATSLYTFNPTPNDEYFTNPGMGWQDAADGSLTQLLPDSTRYVPRHQISWQVLNPGNGVYDWSVLDAHLVDAIAQNKQLSFRVYTMRGESWGGHQIPQWVLDNGAVILNNGSPDYNNCTYQYEWGRFVNELSNRYDGVDQIAFIDVSGYGNFNEWSWEDDQTTWEDDPNNPVTLDGQARDRLSAMFLGGADSNHECSTANGNVQTVSYNYSGFAETQMVMPYAGIRQTAARIVERYPDVGIRYDCLGRIGSGLDETSGLMGRIGDQINATWPNAPIIYEFCGGVGGSEDYMQEAEALLADSHATMVNDTLLDPRDANRIEDLMMPVGYRYQLDRASYTSILTSGDDFTIEMLWRNIGYAPAYAKMGQEFSLHIYLVDAAGNIVVDENIPANINDWMPADPLPGTAPENIVTDEFALPSLANGTYSLRVAIIENRTNNPINLAISGREADGSYYLGSVIVEERTAPTATNTPIPPTATITNTPLPTATDTPIPVMPTMTNTPIPASPTMTSTPISIPTATQMNSTSPTPIPPLEETNPTMIPAEEDTTSSTEPTPIPTEDTSSGSTSGTSNTGIPGDVIYVADLDGWSEENGNGNRWHAYVRITVYNGNGEPVPQVDVTGSWSSDDWNESCYTDSNGSCVIRRRGLHSNQDGNSVSLTISSISNWEYQYRPTYNRDPDGDSNGTSITVNR